MGSHAILDVVPSPTGIVEGGIWRYANPALRTLIGRELVGVSILELVAPAERVAIAHCYDGRSGMHSTRWIRGNGTQVVVEVAIAEFDGGQVVSVTDMSAHQLLFDRLDQTEASFRALVESSPDAMFVHADNTDDAELLWANPAMLALLGYEKLSQLAGRRAADIFVDPEDRERLAVYETRAGNVVEPSLDVKWNRSDGQVREISATWRHVVFADTPAVLVIARDVTDERSRQRERAESEAAMRRIEEQLRQSQKMEAVGQLAGGVAHDFNNLLAVILAMTSFLSDELGEQHPCIKDIAEIEEAANRAATLTRQLLAFSRKQPHTPKLLSVRTIVQDLEKMLRRILGEDVELSTRLLAPGKVLADAGQLEQVIMNLVVNARDAMPKGGHLSIETSYVTLDDSGAGIAGVSAGSYTMIAVSDSGCGMDDDTKRRIFEPFFTTKAVGKGTGLGLATVFGIVKQSGGGISVYSEVGRGSTFRIYLPRADGEQEKATTERAASQTGSESILVVEDDAQLRGVIQRRLRALGYQTITAHDATSAIEVFASAQVDLVLTDLVMPGLDGRALAAKLLATRPDLKVVFMSGYSEHAAVKTAALGPDEHFIEKPFTGDQLSITVRRALENESPFRARAY